MAGTGLFPASVAYFEIRSGRIRPAPIRGLLGGLGAVIVIFMAVIVLDSIKSRRRN